MDEDEPALRGEHTVSNGPFVTAGTKEVTHRHVYSTSMQGRCLQNDISVFFPRVEWTAFDDVFPRSGTNPLVTIQFLRTCCVEG